MNTERERIGVTLSVYYCNSPPKEVPQKIEEPTTSPPEVTTTEPASESAPQEDKGEVKGERELMDGEVGTEPESVSSQQPSGDSA